MKFMETFLLLFLFLYIHGLRVIIFTSIWHYLLTKQSNISLNLFISFSSIFIKHVIKYCVINNES